MTENKTLTNKAFDGKAVFYRTISYLKNYRTALIIAIACIILLSLTQVGVAGILEPIINQGVVDRNATSAKVLPFVMFALMVMRAVFGYFSSYIMSKIGRALIRDIRRDMFNNVVYLPTAYYDNTPSTTLISKFLYDVEQLALMATNTLSNLLRSTLTIIGLLGWMIYLDWKLSLIVFLSAPFILLITSFANKRFRKVSKDIQDSMGNLADYVKEVSQGHKAVKTYNAQQFEVSRFKGGNAENYKQNIRRIRVSSAVVPVTTLCIAPIFTLLLFIYLNYMVEGSHAVGKFVSFITAFGMLMSPIKTLAKANEQIQVGLTAANSVFSVIDLNKEKNTGNKKITDLKGELTFDSVSFSYNEESGNVVNNVSFSIPAGKRVALVGSSGSGKSTLASLLLRFYTPASGTIKLDGTDITQYDLSDYRDQVSLVSQEAILFDDTIRSNIVYGNTDKGEKDTIEIDEKRLKKAMDSAYVTEFVNDLKDGLDTIVGEQGLLLSGGQRQRISIARAFYKDAPIIILDEATSALDVKSEKYIQNALDELMQNKTSVVIAHRLSTIESADQIVVMSQGEVAEQGTHNSLLKSDGIYADFQRSQKLNLS